MSDVLALIRGLVLVLIILLATGALSYLTYVILTWKDQ